MYKLPVVIAWPAQVQVVCCGTPTHTKYLLNHSGGGGGSAKTIVGRRGHSSYSVGHHRRLCVYLRTSLLLVRLFYEA